MAFYQVLEMKNTKRVIVAGDALLLTITFSSMAIEEGIWKRFSPGKGAMPLVEERDCRKDYKMADNGLIQRSW